MVQVFKGALQARCEAIGVANWLMKAQSTSAIQCALGRFYSSHPSPPCVSLALPQHALTAVRCCAAPSEPEDEFRTWLKSSGQPVATDLPIVTSSATTAEGALRDVWRAVIAASDASSPPVSVLLLPGVPWLKRWERMEALFSHLRSCRGCSRFLGSTVRLQALHPSYSSSPDESEIEVERKRAPVPAFTLSRRVGPSTLRPTGVDDNDEDDKDYVEEDESTRKAREALERQFLAASTAGAAPPPPPPPLPPNVVIRDSVATASEPIGI